jgi:lysophospholipase L1-like esterase
MSCPSPFALASTLLGTMLLIAALASPSGAAPALFHSPADDGLAAPSTPVESAIPLVTLFLYVDGGPVSTSTGTPCEDGDGDEVCAWEFSLETTGDVTLQGFVPEPGIDLVERLSASEFAAIGGNAIGGDLGPTRLGALDLAVTSSNWSVKIIGGSAVNASFSLTSLPPIAIAVPEPTLPLQLAFGIAFLIAMGKGVGRSFLLLGLVVVAFLTPTLAFAQDADADGVLDATDNCVHTANPGQEDVAGLFGPPADGIGDACQCGDVTGDGGIDLLDAATYQRGLAGVLPTLLNEDKCSVIGGRLDCDPNDQRALREALIESGPGLAQACQSANAVPPAPAHIVAAGDSITQAFAADCTCNAGFFGLICLLCPAGGDQPQHSWFNGNALGNSFFDLYGGPGSGIVSSRVSVSGAEMSTGPDSFSIQADNILALSPIPDLVVVELGGNDVCNRSCVDSGSCGNPLYSDAAWTTAIEAGLDKLVGFGHPTSLAANATVYILGVPRVQDLYAAGVAKQATSSTINCDSFRDSFDVCEIATLNAPMNGEDLTTRLTALEQKIPRYNEIIRDLALEYNTNSNGRNPLGIEIVTDYVNESIASVGTTSFGANEINGGDCFHPSVSGQSILSAGAWFSNPR